MLTLAVSELLSLVLNKALASATVTGHRISHSLITYTVHSCSFCFAKIVGGLVPWETGSMLTYRHPEHGPFGTTRSIETDVFAQILSYDYGRGQN